MGALADYNKAIELDPEDAISLNNRGLIEEKLGRMHLAQESFSQADMLSGVDLSTASESQMEQKKVDERPKREEIGIKYYMTILKKLLSSSSERKKFYRFLFKQH